MIYDKADQAIRLMNRLNVRTFNRLKLAKFDEINLIRKVSDVYDESARRAREQYYELAVEAYILAMLEAGKTNLEATRRANRDIDASWILALLEEVDPVTFYAFFPEMERKKQRLTEALSVAQNKNAEVDKALRYWTVQVAQYADNTVYWARLEAFKQAGVGKVMWVTQKDNRVCIDCDDLDGKIFPIDKVPPPQHIHCRCTLKPVHD